MSVGRWFGMDPLAEKYTGLSGYVFSGNNPLLFVDENGMDYWGTNDPLLIESFLSGLQRGMNTHDFAGWMHATDSDILGDLVYNDELHRYYTSIGTVLDGEATRMGLSFDAILKPVVESYPYLGAFVREPLTGFWESLCYFLGIGGYNQYDMPSLDVTNLKNQTFLPLYLGVTREGRLIDATPRLITGTPPIPGKISSKGLPHGDAGRTWEKARKRIDALKEQLKTAKGKEKKEIKNGIEKIRKDAEKKKKGETHWRR